MGIDGNQSLANGGLRGDARGRAVATSSGRSSRAELTVLALLVVGYGAFYLCRANVDAAMPLLSRDLGYDKTQLGALSSVAVLAYAIGKIALGLAGDAVGGKRIFLIALSGSVVMSLVMGTATSLVALTVCAAANRFFQSGGWGGLVHVVSRWFPPERHGTAAGVAATSYEIGYVATLLVCGGVVRAGYSWRALFVVNPALLAAAGIVVALFLKEGSPKAAAGRSRGEEADEQVPLEHFARKPAFWATVALSVLLTFVRTGFLTWTPTYLADIASAAHETAPHASAMVKSAIFPAAGIVAALGMGRITDRLGPGRRAPVLALSLVALTLSVLALAHLPAETTLAAALRIGASGLFLLGPYSMLAGSLTLDAAGTRGTATAAGIVDGVGYLGASASGIVLGVAAQRFGWGAAFDVIAAASACAAALSVVWALAGRRRGAS